MTEVSPKVAVDQPIEEVQSEIPPKVNDANQNSEMRYAPLKDMQAPEQDQSSGAKSPEIHGETPSHQPHEDESSDFPFSNMSFEEFERQQ